MPFELLIRTLLRRISLLAKIHCEANWELPYKEIIAQANTIPLGKSDLRWVDWERYSTRQRQRMNLGGFVGASGYSGSVAPFLPLILLGQFVHVGKNTTFGLGKFLVQA